MSAVARPGDVMSPGCSPGTTRAARQRTAKSEKSDDAGEERGTLAKDQPPAVLVDQMDSVAASEMAAAGQASPHTATGIGSTRALSTTLSTSACVRRGVELPRLVEIDDDSCIAGAVLESKGDS